MAWLDRLVAELLTPLAAWVLVSGLDDLFPDLSYLYFRIRDRLAARRHPRPDSVRAEPESRIAILVPCWDESAIIERMVEHNLAAIDYAEYEIWLGVYPNDAASLEKARRCAEKHASVHYVACPHDGPTTKADCLNHIVQGLLHHERTSGALYDVIVQHDAEDLIHPQALRLINQACRENEMIQLPVFALPTPLTNPTHGVYCDEFAEFHLKELWVRSRLGGFVPSAGVGTALRRDALDRLRIAHGDEIFHPESLTEDYFLGLELHRLGCAQTFRLQEAHGALREPDSRTPVATRAYFPRTFRAALSQRTRWLTGNNLQAWQRFGWRTPARQLYWLWRDRKGLLAHPTALVANLAFLYGVASWFASRSAGEAWVLGEAVVSTPFLAYLLAVNAGLIVWRQAVRGVCAWRIYGPAQALTVPVRAPWANWINFIATLGALASFARARFREKPLLWAKTRHAYPAGPALRAHGRKLGEVLVSLGRVSEKAVAQALNDRNGGSRLGERLIGTGEIEERDVYEALAVQHSLAFSEIQPSDADPRAEQVYSECRATIPCTVAYQTADDGIWIAGIDPPAEGQIEELAAELGREVRFVLVTPSNYGQLRERLKGTGRAVASGRLG